VNADPPKILIIVQLMHSLQLWKSSIKATKGVSTLTDVLFPDHLSPTVSVASAVKTPDSQSSGPSASL